MKLHFKPLPGLTIATVIALAILIALGTWQLKRLQWKTALLSEIEQVADAAPFKSFADVQAALDAGEPIDFRRIGVTGEVQAEPPFYVFTSQQRDISWRVFAPVQEGNILAFAALETLVDSQKNEAQSFNKRSESLTGYVRLARPMGRGETKSSPERDRWFGFNPMPVSHDWAIQVSGDPDMRFYIDTVPGALDANLLPARRPDIRNNHFDYMLTWYGLAVVLLVIYLIMHRRAGRLGGS